MIQTKHERRINIIDVRSISNLEIKVREKVEGRVLIKEMYLVLLVFYNGR